ncbi:hypothetical protein Bpfe_000590 [Biomphalaria pfeifferi]|uniref:Uncharacterized protein n=1 Tax=Biomphalaria pfeifferi TaxID=112525 RepID=A0AAD8CBP3_BIOPF|nr:hypothetical protein Bpfe_000590 [Biomphalaria pfeifferi]
MHLTEVVHIASDLERAQIFLQTHNILRKTPPNCPTCERAMNEIKSADRHDKVIYRCPSHKSRKMSIRAGSILSRSRLSLSDFTFGAYRPQAE